MSNISVKQVSTHFQKIQNKSVVAHWHVISLQNCKDLHVDQSLSYTMSIFPTSTYIRTTIKQIKYFFPNSIGLSNEANIQANF